MAYWLNLVAFLAFTTIHQTEAFFPTLNDDIWASVLPRRDGALFLANISIGSPPIPHLFKTRALNLDSILGLVATSPYHLFSCTGIKFSYCIGNISDTRYMYNQLILGHESIIQGDSTPMQIRSYHYVVSIEGITIGDKFLITMNPLEFKNNVIFDSGSTYTRLRKSAYDSLAAHIAMLAQRFFLTPVSVRGAERNQLCYKGDLGQDLKGFPIVTLNLAGGATLDLDVESLFQMTTDGSAFCMAIVESESNVIGLMAQQYYNVGFDVGAGSISFQRIDCQLLLDE